MAKGLSAQAKLKKQVLEQSLCTGCGACVGLCPYQVIHADRTVQLFSCDLQEGKCYTFCPRTSVDFDRIRRILYDSKDITAQIGAVKGFYLARAADPHLRAKAQHGGTVTALLQLAMEEGLISAAIVSGQNEEGEPEGRVIDKSSELIRYAKSRFTVSPTVAAFHQMPDGFGGKLGVVATPCQATAFAKIRTSDIEGYTKGRSLGLVIGLFCGWTLSPEKFKHLLGQYDLTYEKIIEMDIPAGRSVLSLKTAGSDVEIPLSEVDACVRTACRYCVDSTAELADLSVGAARYGGECCEMAGWNQVIVRSETGAKLMNLAGAKGVVEILEAPAQAFDALKAAAAEKKKKGLKAITIKTGSAKKLLYLSSDDPVVKAYLKG